MKHPSTQAPKYLSMAAMAALLLGSACQRETISGPASSPVAEENLTPRIAAFVALAQHGASTDRDAAPYSADSAAWYVEGALNYSLAQPWLPYNELVNDSLTVALASTGGTVNAGDAANAYVALAGQLQQALTGEDLHLVVVDAEPHATAEGLELKIRYAMGQGHDRLSLNTTYPAYTSLFFYTQGGGANNSCDPNYWSNYGADKVIQGRVAATIPLLAVGQYYASVETWEVGPGLAGAANTLSIQDFPNANNTSGRYNQDFLIFSCDGTTCGTCLDQSDMAFHTQGTYDVMNLINSNHCPTKQPASIAVYEAISGGWETYFCHDVVYTYGKPQYALGH